MINNEYKDDLIKSRVRLRAFTLVEIITSLTVLVGIMLIALIYLNSTQKVWTLSETSRDMGEDARIALDLMSKDLESIIYYDYDQSDDTASYLPFLYWGESEASDADQLLLFVSQTPFTWNIESDSSYFEVNYFVDFDDSKLATLRRRAIPYTSGTFKEGAEDIKITGSSGKIDNSDDTDSQPYLEVIKNITDFKIICYNKNAEEILNEDSSAFFPREGSSISVETITDSDYFPFAMEVKLTLIPVNIGQKVSQLMSAGKESAADSLRDNNKKTFSRFIFIGERVP